MGLGYVGLGKMGAGMVARLVQGGHTVTVFDRAPEAVARAVESGALGASSLESLVQRLSPPRAVWIMVPAGDATESTIESLGRLLSPEDTIVDGGNSHYEDSRRRAAGLRERGVYLLDVGTSGGVWGLHEGYSLMIGGERTPVERLGDVFATLAPAPERGWGRVGGSGSGHFAKMVHNGIEYGMMQSIAEGFAILRHKEELALDPAQVATIWRHGSVVRSWLLDLTARALHSNPRMEGIVPYVEDSGEGRWMVAEAIALDVPAPVITLALIQRLRSRDGESYADRLLASMRNEFGGHALRRAESVSTREAEPGR